jgi:hypothetical protein
MMRYKTWFIRIGVVLVLYYLFTRPANAAEAVNGAVDGIMQGADQLAVFFSKVLV